MEDATRAFQASDFARAITCYEDYLRLAPAGNQRDHALFQLGLIFALPGHAQHDWMRATQHFTRLATEHPTSSFTAPAKVILELRSEVTNLAQDAEQLNQRNRQLSTELERLKQIDSQRRNR
jgi:TolA-binding protein